MPNHKNLPSFARLRKQACTYGKISKKHQNIGVAQRLGAINTRRW
ncbi:hypothetical protein PTUN_a2921 [Pseudoalteromonas tunicata]|jgi:hypothetical protein|nr:hypothetical protein PTUN_a2921 [Pseudoalteromonas tunicata]